MFYRAKQLWWAITARPVSVQQQKILQALLTEAEIDLFFRFSANDQQHSFRVYDLLQQKQGTDPVMLRSALLHDIGKTELNLTIIDRCLVVALAPFVKDKGEEWGKTTAPYGWRKPFVIKAMHAQWGAEMTSAVGSDPETVSLIARHQDKIDPLDQSPFALQLQLFQWADDLS